MFVTFEGIDASGKTTQIEVLERALKEKGYDVVVTRQPGGTMVGQQIRKILLDQDNTDMTPEAEVLLYMADRLQHLREIICPTLKQNKIVLCDRYHDATVAYQGGGRELDLHWLKPIEDQFLLEPDISIWLDISPEESRERLEKRNKLQGIENCRLESEDIAFFKRIVTRYNEFCEKEPERFYRVSAEDSRSAIQNKILDIILPQLDPPGE